LIRGLLSSYWIRELFGALSPGCPFHQGLRFKQTADQFDLGRLALMLETLESPSRT